MMSSVAIPTPSTFAMNRECPLVFWETRHESDVPLAKEPFGIKATQHRARSARLAPQGAPRTGHLRRCRPWKETALAPRTNALHLPYSRRAERYPICAELPLVTIPGEF